MSLLRIISAIAVSIVATSQWHLILHVYGLRQQVVALSREQVLERGLPEETGDSLGKEVAQHYLPLPTFVLIGAPLLTFLAALLWVGAIYGIRDPLPPPLD